MSQPVSIDHQDLADAFSDTARERQYVLDRQTGRVIHLLLSESNLQELAAFKRELVKQPGRYAQVPKLTPQQRLEEMETFMNGLKDKKLGARLGQALESGGNVYRYFLDALDASPFEKERWYAVTKQHGAERSAKWLKSLGLA